MVKPVKFAHVVYMTRRFDEMIAWYRDVFEAERIAHSACSSIACISASEKPK